MTIALPWPRRSGGAESVRQATGDRSGASAPRAAARFGGGGKEAPYETVYVAGSEPEAYVVKGRLEVEDIPAVLHGHLAVQLWSPGLALHGIEVQVPRTLADRARTVLDNG